jgi:hypothetical protein
VALEALGEEAPDGALLGVRVADLGVRAAMIAHDPKLFFTIPHFDGFPAVRPLVLNGRKYDRWGPALRGVAG